MLLYLKVLSLFVGIILIVLYPQTVLNLLDFKVYGLLCNFKELQTLSVLHCTFVKYLSISRGVPIDVGSLACIDIRY